ncbi:MAG: hypothetical protein M1820_010540 [Bogoriella megaspora]|nr:MAG: hypothetical protein M1820_010540 [Bogoriella megaspora]
MSTFKQTIAGPPTPSHEMFAKTPEYQYDPTYPTVRLTSQVSNAFVLLTKPPSLARPGVRTSIAHGARFAYCTLGKPYAIIIRDSHHPLHATCSNRTAAHTFSTESLLSEAWDDFELTEDHEDNSGPELPKPVHVNEPFLNASPSTRPTECYVMRSTSVAASQDASLDVEPGISGLAITIQDGEQERFLNADSESEREQISNRRGKQFFLWTTFVIGVAAVIMTGVGLTFTALRWARDS